MCHRTKQSMWRLAALLVSAAGALRRSSSSVSPRASVPQEPVQVDITADTLEQVVPPHRYVSWKCVGCLFVAQCPDAANQDEYPSDATSKRDSFYPASHVGRVHDSGSDFYVLRVGMSESVVQQARKASEHQHMSMAGMMLPEHAVQFSCHTVRIKVRYIRKALRELTDDEWNRYVAAFWNFKNGYLPDHEFPNHDAIVSFHAAATLNPRNLTSGGPGGDHYLGDQAHGGPAFALWHTVLLLGFEQALQAYDPSVAAHYWDWTNDPLAVFNSRFYGESDESAANGCRVLNGPFQNWTVSLLRDVQLDKWTEWIVKKSNANDAHARLRGPGGELLEERNISHLGRRPAGPFLDVPPGNLSDVREALDKESYYQMWCRIFWRSGVCNGAESDEGNLHGMVHGWMTGFINPGEWSQLAINDGGDIATSPNDPAFFGHHAMVERIHQAWFLSKGQQLATSEDPCGGYDNPYQRVGHDLHDVWEPKIHLLGSPEGESAFTACQKLLGDSAPYVYNKYF